MLLRTLREVPAADAVDVTAFGVKLPFQSPEKAIQQVRINGVFNFGDNPQASFIRNNLTWAMTSAG
jgi:hypothetical protein